MKIGDKKLGEEQKQEEEEEEQTATATTRATGLVDGSQDVRLSKLTSCRLNNNNGEYQHLSSSSVTINSAEKREMSNQSYNDHKSCAKRRYLPYLEESPPPPLSSSSSSQNSGDGYQSIRGRLANEEEEKEEIGSSLCDNHNNNNPQEPSNSNLQQGRRRRRHPQQEVMAVMAGAYAEAFGESTKRREDVRFSLVGAEPGQPMSASTVGVAFSLVGGPPDPRDIENFRNQILLDNTVHHQEEGTEQEERPANDGGGGRDGGDDGLAQAMPVTEENVSTQETAQPYDVETAEQKMIENTVQHKKSILAMALVVAAVLVCGVILAIKLVGRNKDNNLQIVVSSKSRSDSPSLPPSSSAGAVLDFLMENLPEQTQQRICCNSPQMKAWEWLLNHPNVTNYEEWRKKQLFALATFYYSFEGENWNPLIQERWMDYDKEECLWFSNGYGFFCSLEWGCYDNPSVPEEYAPLSAVGLPIIPSCSNDKRFISLDLQDLHLPTGSQPSMPPEIVLLTSLSRIDLGANEGIDAFLSDVLPLPEMLQLTKLTQLSYYGVDLTGQIPSQLGLMTNLLYLNLDNIALTGHLPSQLGLLTSAMSLSVGGSNLTGSIPSQLGLMTMMERFHMHGNQFSGSISSQLLGGMTNLVWLSLYDNNMTGPLPTQLGLLTAMGDLWMFQNHFTGSIPSQLGLLHQNLDCLQLENNALTGTIPSELESLVALNGGNLTVLALANNSLLSGTIPEGLCSLGDYGSHWWTGGLSFDCGERLCGCCWCPCSNISSYTCQPK